MVVFSFLCFLCSLFHFLCWFSTNVLSFAGMVCSLFVPLCLQPSSKSEKHSSEKTNSNEIKTQLMHGVKRRKEEDISM